MLRTIAMALILTAPAVARAQDAVPPTAPVPRVSGGVMAGLLLTKVAPVYPAEARAAHLQGVVVLRALVGVDGTVKSLEMLNGPPELKAAATDAVSQWTYRPYLLNGKVTAVDTTITVRFTLADATADPRPARPVADTKGPASTEALDVPAEVMTSRLVSRVNPTYPPDAKAKGISGAVVLKTVVARDGSVSSLSVVSGPEDLRDVALEAVRQWVYKPYLVNGEPVPVQTTVTVHFTLGG